MGKPMPHYFRSFLGDLNKPYTLLKKKKKNNKPIHCLEKHNMWPNLVENEKSYQIHPLHASILLSVSYWILCNV